MNHYTLLLIASILDNVQHQMIDLTCNKCCFFIAIFFFDTNENGFSVLRFLIPLHQNDEKKDKTSGVILIDMKSSSLEATPSKEKVYSP